jgi:hypothetical protein
MYACNQEHFQANSAIHNVNERIGPIFIDQLPTFLVLKKLHRPTILASKYSTVYHLVSKSYINKKEQFKETLKSYLNTRPFYSVEFLMFKNDSEFLMFKNDSIFLKVCCLYIIIIIISGTTARTGPWPSLTGFRDG